MFTICDNHQTPLDYFDTLAEALADYLFCYSCGKTNLMLISEATGEILISCDENEYIPDVSEAIKYVL